MWDYNVTEARALIGKTLQDVSVSDSVVSFKADGKEYLIGHSQNCCESVYLSSQSGNLEKICKGPITSARKGVEAVDNEYGIAATSKIVLENQFTTVTFIWDGKSNGYYSVGIDVRCKED